MGPFKLIGTFFDASVEVGGKAKNSLLNVGDMSENLTEAGAIASEGVKIQAQIYTKESQINLDAMDTVKSVPLPKEEE